MYNIQIAYARDVLKEIKNRSIRMVHSQMETKKRGMRNEFFTFNSRERLIYSFLIDGFEIVMEKCLNKLERANENSEDVFTEVRKIIYNIVPACQQGYQESKGMLKLEFQFRLHGMYMALVETTQIISLDEWDYLTEGEEF